jgi:flagellin-specific chaperone FliS
MNHFSKAVNEVVKRANQNAARCVCIWAALALREEGLEGGDIKRILENILKYSKTTLGQNDIENQAEHIEKVTGLRIKWKNDDITIEDLEEWDEED